MLAWLLTALSEKVTAAETTGKRANAERTPNTEPYETVSPGREVLRLKRQEDAEHTVQAARRRGERSPSLCFAFLAWLTQRRFTSVYRRV